MMVNKIALDFTVKYKFIVRGFSKNKNIQFNLYDGAMLIVAVVIVICLSYS